MAALLLSADADPLTPTDPLVALDAAKTRISEGRLADASDMLSALPTPSPDEAFIAEEALLQQMLIDCALLSAAHYLHRELVSQRLEEMAYGRWLDSQREQHVQAFVRHGEEYLTRTAGGSNLEFVRFYLPEVKEEHVQDAELYSDAAVLQATVTNWEDSRQGLGKGLVAAQARVALVLAAAIFCDLPHPSSALSQVTARLRRGVPVSQGEVLEWLVRTTTELAQPGDHLDSLGRQAQDRLDTLTRQAATDGSAGNRRSSTNSAGGSTSEQS